MSDLTSNTASLEAILATVNALPETGGGSSGGAAVETCTVTFKFGNPTLGETFVYTNEKLEIIESSFNSDTSISVAKNTIMHSRATSYYTVSGGIIKQNYQVCYITGDGNIEF